MTEYAKELGEVLKTFNAEKFRQFVKEKDPMRYYSNLNILEVDQYALGTMAKMILARTDMPEDLIEKSKAILDELEWTYGIV